MNWPMTAINCHHILSVLARNGFFKDLSSIIFYHINQARRKTHSGARRNATRDVPRRATQHKAGCTYIHMCVYIFTYLTLEGKVCMCNYTYIDQYVLVTKKKKNDA